MPTREEQITAANDTADTAYATARNNQGLTPEERTRRIAKAWVQLKDTIDAIRASEENATNGRRDQLAKQIYGLPTAADSLSYRDALDRANQLAAGDTRGAIALLEQARISGDDILTRAVLSVAYTNRWADVINTYTASNPPVEAAADELWSLTTPANANPTEAFVDLADYLAPKPPEISRYDNWAITELASGQSTTSSAFA